MTTREELVALADELRAFLDRSTMNSKADEFLRKVENALRLASRQEVSVGELADSFPFVSRRIAEAKARALLAKYSITKQDGGRRWIFQNSLVSTC